MPMPTMLDMEAIKAASNYTEDQVFDLGIDGVLKFLVYVPQIGACEVPQSALEEFAAGSEEVVATGMREHYSGALSGERNIKRAQLRISKESADAWKSLTIRHFASVEPGKNILAFGDLFTIADAAASIARQLAWDDATMVNLRDALAEGCANGDLIIRDRDAKPLHHNDSPVSTEALVSAIDVNAWLKATGAGYEWSTEAEFTSGWDLFNEMDEIKQKITYWSSRDDTTARDAEIREAKLAPLKLRLADLEENKRHMRGDVVEVESLAVLAPAEN